MKDEQASLDAGSRYRIDRGPDHLLLRRIDRPNTAWRITTTELLGPRSDGAGLLLDFEALDGLARIGRMTLQWDPSFKAFRVNFATRSMMLGAQVFDVHAESVYVSMESVHGHHAVLFNPRTQETTGSLPESALTVMKEVAQLFGEMQEPLGKWAEREERISGCLKDGADDGTSVIFQQKADKKEECKRDRTTGWVKAGLAFLGGLVAGVLTLPAGGLGAAVVVALVGGAAAGAEAADTENQHDSCRKEAE